MMRQGISNVLLRGLQAGRPAADVACSGRAFSAQAAPVTATLFPGDGRRAPAMALPCGVAVPWFYLA